MKVKIVLDEQLLIQGCAMYKGPFNNSASFSMWIKQYVMNSDILIKFKLDT